MSYYRTGGTGGYYRPSFFGGFSYFPRVVKWLMIANVVVWLFVNLFPRLVYLLALMPVGSNFQPWQLATYMFVHIDFLPHLFMNMLALWMFGMEIENLWGSKKFLTYYLLCGFGAGIAHVVIPPLLGQAVPAVGASGAVYGVMIAFGIMFPNRPVYIYFLFPIKAKFLIAIFIGTDLLFGVSGAPSKVAHFAHLGGAAVGFVYMLADMGLLPVHQWWRRTVGQVRNPFARPGRSGDGEIHEARFYDIKSGKTIDHEDDVTQEVIDAILDKISTGGYQSLTDEEKRILNEASRKIH
jgi:membrane associated rhomboid family serine protease